MALAGAVIAALALGGVFAYADTVSADGDTVTPNNNLSYTPSANFTAHCSDRGPAVAGVATIKFNGGQDTGRAPHYDPGATVTVTDVPDAAGAAAGITASGGTGTVPATWDTFGESFGVPISTTVPPTVPDGTYVMNVTASGPAHDSHGEPLIHETSDTYKVLIACGNTSPTIAWAANPSSANEGTTTSYTFSITDPDSTSWSFAAGYPSCGAGRTVAGTPSIDSSAKTGTFDCSFPNGPASSTVSAEVSDGTNASQELDQAVAVANVAPQVSFTSAPANAFEGETKTFVFAVSDPGATDTYTGIPDCGAHGTYVSGSLAVSGPSGGQTGDFKCTFPAGPASTTISIAFTDSDGATGAPATTIVTVQDAPLTVGALTVTDGVEGITASHLSFGFTDANPAATAADYTATINWGDGISAPGTVSSMGVGFAVSGSHTYAEEGVYTASVSVLDAGGSSTSASGPAQVADAALAAGTFTVGDGVEGTTASPLSFSFTDANPGATAAEFTATITWGDGNSSLGTVTAASGGGFDVSGSHTYAVHGSYTAGVTVKDAGGSRHELHCNRARRGRTAHRRRSDDHERRRGCHFLEPLVRVHRREPGRNRGRLHGHNRLGRRRFRTGDPQRNGGGVFTAAGSHLYAEEGTFHATVTVIGDGGSTAVGHGDAHVADALLTSGTLTVGNGVEGVTASPLSFRFTDANPAATVSDFTATITGAMASALPAPSPP